MERCEIKLMNKDKLANVKWTRDDYVRDEGDEDCREGYGEASLSLSCLANHTVISNT